MAELIQTSIKVGNKFLTPKGIGRNNLSINDCLAELVANSLDWNAAKLDDSDVIIRLIIGDDYITLVDNGAGMDIEELDLAINLAEAEDKIRDRLNEQERKGMYGMGLKIASLTLGWKLVIETVSFKDEDVQYKFKFDSRKLDDPNSNYLEEGLFIVKDSRASDSHLEELKHGTSITISDLEKDISSMSYVAIKEDLQSRFLPDINNLIKNYNLDFQIIRKKGEHTQSTKMEKVITDHLFEDDVLRVDFDKPQKWAKKESYIYTGSNGKDYQLKGFLHLKKKRSVKDQNFGLNLYYNGQLIERFHKGDLLSIEGRRREMTYGELHLEGCTPDPSKKKFIEDKAFKNVKNLIWDDLQVYKKLSPTSKDQNKLVTKEVDRRKGIKKKHKFEDESDDVEKAKKKKEEPKSRLNKMPDGTIEVNENLYILISKEWIHNRSLDESRGTNWDSAYLKSKDFDDLWTLQVYINPDSELYKGIDNLYQRKSDSNKIRDFFKKIAISECIYDKLMEAHDFSQDYARELTDTKVYPQVLKLKILD